MPVRIGILGGTGVYRWGGGEPVTVDTEFGPVIVHHSMDGRNDRFFLPRHGPEHEVPAHLVDHHRNLRALAACRVDYVLGVFNVGAVARAATSGRWVIPDDHIDLRGTPTTLFDDVAVHVDGAEPFCPTLRRALAASAGTRTPAGGVYATVWGPRLETQAEVRLLRGAGATVVGMTCGPEASLSRELGLCYAALCFVANAAGKNSVLDARRAQAALAKQVPRLRTWLDRALRRLSLPKACSCHERSRQGRLTLAGARA